MKHEDDDRPVSDAPTYDDRWWFTVAVIAFIFAAISFGFVACQTFSVEDKVAVARAQAFTPFGVALIAAVTFFTVVWRGVLSTQQIKLQSDQLTHQAEQLRQIIRQNDAKDDEALVKLLQEGAKFIAEEEKEAQILAGIASLSALVSNDQQHRYTAQALDILASYYSKHFLDYSLPADNARQALNRAAQNGLKSSVTANFKTDEFTHDWPAVRGFEMQHYSGGYFEEGSYEVVREEAQVFHDVRFHHIRAITEAKFRNCEFINCSFDSFAMDRINRNGFKNCDFSGCRFVDRFWVSKMEEVDLRARGNFYYSDNPPIFEDFDAWDKVLICKERDPEKRVSSESSIG